MFVVLAYFVFVVFSYVCVVRLCSFMICGLWLFFICCCVCCGGLRVGLVLFGLLCIVL